MYTKRVMANQFLSLSLFLMLLSFFIVLNAVSEFEDTKTYPVLNSLSLAFKSKIAFIDASPSSEPDQTETEDKKDGDTLEALEGLFNAHIAGFDLKRNRFGTMMHVRLPMGRLENAINFDNYDNQNIPAGRRGAFLPTMITVLRSAQAGQIYRLDMILNIEDDPAEEGIEKTEEFLSALRRITNITQRLETAGLEKKMMSAGLKQGEENMVDMYFYPYEPYVLPVKPLKIQQEPQ